MAVSPHLGRWAYGTLFMVLFPALLAGWAMCLDHSTMRFWPIPCQPWIGWVTALAGGTLMVVSMHALWVIGKGLPMNAYPPRYLVSDSTYGILSHPIYFGFVCMVAGASIIANSPAGLWVVTPIVLLSVVALVQGYEGPRLRQRFGNESIRTPVFAIPEDSPARASWSQRLAAAAMSLGPWALIYSVFSMMPSPSEAHELRMLWEFKIPIMGWTFWLYSAAYPLAIAGPLVLRTNAELRSYIIAAWLATFVGFALMLLLPGRSTFLPISGEGGVAWLVKANRSLDAEWLALPSFHALWVVFFAYCFQRRFPRFSPLWALLSGSIFASCVLTGSHAVIDVICGVALAVLAWHHGTEWRWLVRHAEVLSNSWSATCLGPVRIISHALWSAVAAISGVVVVLWLAGPHLISEVGLVFGMGLIVAGIWGYCLEGGARLSRPFGYYGFLLGSIGTLALLAVLDASAVQRLTAAFACAAPLAQAIGRLRCLVQGCCHGRPVVRVPGIRVVHPNSRVTALSGLGDISIHPTQLYSIVGNLSIFALLCRLWYCGATATLIGGLYLILSSLARFVEEQYRGEPQTPKLFDLAVYQWLAIVLFIVGIVFSMVDGAPVEPASVLTWPGLLTSFIAGSFAALFMSVDFPSSQWRFSRLTVSDTLNGSQPRVLATAERPQIL